MHAETIAVASSGHNARTLASGVLAGAAMAEQADRIFLRHAEQGEAERERDAVRLRRTTSASAAMPASAPLAIGSAASSSGGHAAIREQQQQDEAERADRADAIGFARASSR